MDRVSKHFIREEFACHCGCGFDAVDAQLLKVLESIRNGFSSPVIINSACRCAPHNTYVGGGPKSQHLFGKAADIVVKGHTPEEIVKFLRWKYHNILSIGGYRHFIHVDVREVPVSWGIKY